MRRLFFVACLFVGSEIATAAEIRVVDEAGESVADFEAMYHTADEGYDLWSPGEKGRWELGAAPMARADVDVVDVLVRADGYATAIKRFDRAALEALRTTPATITLMRGREITLRLKLPQGMEVPEGFLPEATPEQYVHRVRAMWQPSNRRAGVDDNFNFLNLKPAGNGVYSLLLTDDTPSFYVASHVPGWLRFFEVGPFSLGDFVDDELVVELPRPATLDVRFDVGERTVEELPFDKVTCSVYWPIPGKKGSFYSVNDHDETMTDGAFRLTDLAPATYQVTVVTQPKTQSDERDPRVVDPGRFYGIVNVPLGDGETGESVISYVPFNPEAWKGDGRARIKVLLANGQPAAGKTIAVVWSDGHYGGLDVFSGLASDEGVVELEGVSTVVVTEAPFGPYEVSVDGERVAWFRLEPTEELQQFEFRMAPKVGDEAPDAPLVTIATGEPVRLANFKGKIVLMEFWATWCGPCQPAMAKLGEHAKIHAAEWGDDVAVVPVSTDREMNQAKSHVRARGWDSITQYWAARNGDAYFTPAELAYGVQGIPHAVLIDREGKVAWAGHPLGDDEGKGMVERIEALRDQ